MILLGRIIRTGFWLLVAWAILNGALAHAFRY